MDEQKDIKEPFCSACAAGLAAVVGAGVSGSSSMVNKRKTKKIVFWVGIVISVLSIVILLYLLSRKESCESCR